MDFKDFLPVILIQIATNLPYFFLWGVGIILAVSRKHLHPGPSRAALAGLAIFFIQLLIMPPLNTFLLLYLDDQGKSNQEIALINTGISGVGTLIGMVAWLLILQAIFGSRNIPTVPKQRHGCLTVYLILAILTNTVAAYAYLFLALAGNLSPSWIGYLLFLVSFGSVIFFTGLFFWKKWGFYGMVALVLTVILMNTYLGLTAGGSMGLLYLVDGFRGLVFIAFLYGVLQIGDQNKGWLQLE